LACRFGEGIVGGADDFGFDGFERLFGGNALDPAVMRELFVVGKIETDEEFYRAGGSGGLFFCGRFLFALGSGLLFGGLGGGRCGRFFAVEFQEHFVAEAETLLPAFDFVASFLSGVFVGAEIEDEKCLGHGSSIVSREKCVKRLRARRKARGRRSAAINEASGRVFCVGYGEFQFYGSSD